MERDHPASVGQILIDRAWGVVVVDTTDSDRPEPDLVARNGWILVCFGQHLNGSCPLADDPAGESHEQEIVVEFDPQQEAHRAFLDHFQSLLKPEKVLRILARTLQGP